VIDNEDVWEGGIVSYGTPAENRRREAKWKDRVLGLRDFRRPIIYRAALTEMVGTMLWIMFLESVNIGFMTAQAEFTSVTPSFLAGLWHMIVLPMLIFATAAASGTHVRLFVCVSVSYG
jgi:hypothetical protein